MTLRIAGALGIALALLASTAVHAAERKLDKTFTVTAGGKLSVDADGSDITVTGTDGDKVVVEIYAKGSRRRVEGMTLAAEQTSEGVSVTAKDRDNSWLDWISWRDETSWVKVQVPRRYDVNLKTSGGDLKIAQLQGAVRAHTSGGDVNADNVRGNIDLETSGGDVETTNIEGALQAHTSGGEVIARNVRGDVELESSGGNISADKVDGAIRAKTSGGNVNVDLVGANRGISATSSGGDIVVRIPKDTAGMVDVSTSGGSVSTDVPVTATKISDSKLTGTLNGGGPEIRVRTSGGDIKLRVSE